MLEIHNQRTRKKLAPFDRDIWSLEMVLGWIEVVGGLPAPTLDEAKEVVGRCSNLGDTKIGVMREICHAAGTWDGTDWLSESCRQLIDACSVGRLTAYLPSGPLPSRRWLCGKIVARRSGCGWEWLLLWSPDNDCTGIENIDHISFKQSEVLCAFPLVRPDAPDPTRNLLSKKSPRRTGRRGRRKGSGSYEKFDAPLLIDMHKLIEDGDAVSPEDAARQVAERAKGNGTLESKADRLAKRYRASDLYARNKSD